MNNNQKMFENLYE